MTEATTETAPDFDQAPELDRAVEARLRPDISPRSTWGEQRPPSGSLEPEGDVRFLLVHHTASANDYEPGDVIEQIRDFHDFHVGPERRWPDLAYNFLVDRFGGIWEARAGSLVEPIQGDATGGSQGFAQLAGLIGNHAEAPPTTEALDALTRLLAWLAHRYRIDTGPGATVTFASRGSNRWPAGTEVTASTISGHRDMSRTTCPGDSVYELLGGSIPEAVQRLRQVALEEARVELGVEAPPATAEPPPSTEVGTTPATIGSESVAVGTEGVEPIDDGRAGEALSPATGEAGDADGYLVPAGVTMIAAGLAGLVALRRRRIGG